MLRRHRLAPSDAVLKADGWPSLTIIILHSATPSQEEMGCKKMLEVGDVPSAAPVKRGIRPF